MAAATLPLHCSICAKRPNFSDVSHLLTHVSSKGHLSTYYKLRVRAATDQSTRDLINTYDRWYVDWNVETLMSDRMHHKENKRARPRPPGRSAKSARAESVIKPNLDPQLSNVFRNSASDELADSLQPLLEAMPSFHPHTAPKPARPRLYLWSTRQPESYQAMPLEISSPPPNFPPFLPWNSREYFPANVPIRTPTTASFDDRESVPEAMKLKGVVWPGMDIFDAATPDMKRKRNQKKDESVLEHLEQSSLAVEATEMIFTPRGALKKSRVITGQADFDSSPLLAQISPRHKQRASRRPALIDRNVNSSRNMLGRQTLTPAVIASPTNGDKSDGMRLKRAFDVFNDSANDSTGFSEHPSMRLLTAGFPSASHPNLAAQYAPSTGYTFQPSLPFDDDFFGHPAEMLQSVYGQSSFYSTTGLDISPFFEAEDSEMPAYGPHVTPGTHNHDQKIAIPTEDDCHESQDSYVSAACRNSN